MAKPNYAEMVEDEPDRFDITVSETVGTITIGDTGTVSYVEAALAMVGKHFWESGDPFQRNSHYEFAHNGDLFRVDVSHDRA